MVTMQHLNYSENGFYGDSFYYWSVSSLKAVSIVMDAMQHINSFYGDGVVN